MSRTLTICLSASSVVLLVLIGALAGGFGATEPSPEPASTPPEEAAARAPAPPPEVAPASTPEAPEEAATREQTCDEARDDRLWRAEVLRDEPWQGASDPIVHVVIFGAYQSIDAAQVMALVEAEVARYPDDVRLVWKDYPHPSKGSGVAAALAAGAARRLGCFWPMHRRLVELGSDEAKLDLRAVATELDIALSDFDAALAHPDVEAGFRADLELACRLDVTTTPTLFVNGRRLKGMAHLGELPSLVDEQRKRALQMVHRGVARSDVYDLIMARARTGAAGG